MKKILIIGAGGHARCLMHAIKSMGCFDIVGLVDPEKTVGEKIGECTVLGSDDLLDCMEFADVELSIGFGIMKASDRRMNTFRKYKKVGYTFAVIRDPHAIVAENAMLNEGVQLMPGTVIQPGADIGENVIVNTSAVIEHDCVIGAHCHIGPAAVIGGGVTIGRCTLVGMGACILPGIHVGSHVTIGAGAVVTHDIADGETVCGVPARIMTTKS